jgi:hypothetical protein
VAAEPPPTRPTVRTVARQTDPEVAPTAYPTTPTPTDCRSDPDLIEYDYEAASEALDGHGAKSDVFLRAQKSSLRLLHRMRFGTGEVAVPFMAWITIMKLDLTRLYDRAVLGERVAFTQFEDEAFATDPMGRKRIEQMRKGRTVVLAAARFPQWIVPAGETKRDCAKRRRKFRREQRKKEAISMFEQQRHAAGRPRPVAGTIKPSVDNEARIKSFIDGLPMPPTTTTIEREARRLRRHPAWRGPSGQRLQIDYIEQTIRRMRRAHPDLIGFRIELIRRLPTLLIWRLKP